MSKLNTKAKPRAVAVTTKNGEYRHTKINELTERVLTAFFGEAKAYESGSAATAQLVALTREVAAEEPLFVAKLAILAREQFHLRTVSQVLVAELSRVHNGDSMVSALINRVVQRPDEMSDMLAYLTASSGKQKSSVRGRVRRVDKKIPAQIRKGIAAAFGKFDEYQLSKYSCESKAMKLRDVLNIVRPKPQSPEQASLWKRVLEGTLKTADTWETNLSAAGQDKDGDTNELKSAAWETMITEKKLGYMAALRNIRNIIEAKVSANAHKMLQDFISNEKAVANSKQLPFRFWSAYRIVSGLTGNNEIRNGYLKALNRALFYSGKNFPKLKGRTVLVTDLSGSMETRLSKDSEVTYMEVGAVLMAIATQFCENVITIGFGQEVAVIQLSDDPDHTLDDVKKIKETQRIVGHSTEAHKVMNLLAKNNVVADNIIFFTDTMFNGGSYQMAEKNYRSTINKDVYIYSVNLAGKGTTQHDTNNPRNIFMGGWSDNLLKYIADYQQYKDGIVGMVEKVEFEF